MISNPTTDITGAYPRTVNVLVGFPGQDGKGNMKDSCKKKECAYWRDTPLGDSHHKCMTCCHSAWLPKSDKDNYKPNAHPHVTAAPAGTVQGDVGTEVDHD